MQNESNTISNSSISSLYDKPFDTKDITRVPVVYSANLFDNKTKQHRSN